MNNAELLINELVFTYKEVKYLQMTHPEKRVKFNLKERLYTCILKDLELAEYLSNSIFIISNE